MMMMLMEPKVMCSLSGALSIRYLRYWRCRLLSPSRQGQVPDLLHTSCDMAETVPCQHDTIRARVGRYLRRS